MIATLPLKVQVDVKRAIRNFCKNVKSPDGFNLYQLAHQEGQGLEECEENVAKLLAQGLIQLTYQRTYNRVTKKRKVQIFLVFPKHERRSNADRRKN